MTDPNSFRAKNPNQTLQLRNIETLIIAFVSGAAMMVVEILGTRIIGPIFGVGLFVWSALISVTMASLALGYYLGGILIDRAPQNWMLNLVVSISGGSLGITSALRPGILQASESLGPRIGALFSATLLFGPCLTFLGMVGPISVRLITNTIQETGHRVGRIYAVSTAGSLIGTLLTGFILIPAFDTYKILFGVATTLLVLGAFPLFFRRRRAAVAGVILIPLMLLLQPQSTLPPDIRIVESLNSLYGRLEVIDDLKRNVRFLRADHSIIGAHYKTNQFAAFAFLHILESVRFFRPEAEEMLQIGLGTGALATALRPYKIKSDVVEIDPEIVQLAQLYFDFSSQREVFIEDARTFLRRTERRYDIIVHDTFIGGTTPEHLLSVEVLKRIREVLRPGGLLALNFPGYHLGANAEAAWSMVRTLRTVFPNVRVFRDLALDDQPNALANLIFFASDSSLDIHIPADARFENPDCEKLIRSFESWEVLLSPDSRRGHIITDSWNPLTILQVPIAEAHYLEMNKLLPSDVWR